MATLTASDFATQMIAQLRVLDPSISALVGTPERKLIDTVAQALADNQVDLTGLAGALDIDSKFGTNLDRFTALFGFARQAATAATGFVTFSRNTPAPATIQIPVGTEVQANVANGALNTGQLQYVTTAGGVIAAGTTTSGAVPVQCTVTGTQGNAAAATLTQLVGTNPPPGVTAVTNDAPITGGTDTEDDNSFKVRFKNTIFRNLSGTNDQYLALALSTSYTTKANVIGPVSAYREYVQVPDFDDAGYLAGVQTLAQNTGGVQGQWTTALSAIPYAQDVYTDRTPFVSNGQTGAAQYFYRNGVDFFFNYPSAIYGDAQREAQTAATSAPNWTFLNVFNPSSGVTPAVGLQSATPGGIVLVEYSYLSGASRNSIQHNVYNAVDIYVDGSNPTQTACTFLPGAQTFTSSPTDPFYMENYRRDGEPATRPHPGNFFTPLLNAPITALPDTITVGTTNYYLGVHYWLIHDVSSLHGSIRARDGIEWSNFLGADAGTENVDADGIQIFSGDLAPYTTTGPTINNLVAQTTIEVDNYNYDANIVILQAAIEKARQITTDALVHQAKLRYFKLDVTVIYAPNVNYAVVNAAIGTAVQVFLDNQALLSHQFFGAVIQLSSLLSVIQQVPGVEDVRWTNDLPNAPNLMRIIECDVGGHPLHVPTVDRIVGGSVSGKETQRLYIPGGHYTSSTNFGASDSFTLSWNDDLIPVTFTSSAISFDALTVTNIQNAIQATAPGTGLYHGITVTADQFTTNPTYPIATFQLFYGNANGTPFLPTVSAAVTQSPYAYDTDFFLRDDELPSLPTGTVSGDAVPGVIIRPRAHNTFVRPGIG